MVSNVGYAVAVHDSGVGVVPFHYHCYFLTYSFLITLDFSLNSHFMTFSKSLVLKVSNLKRF
ncbi:hypothetical protein NAB1_2567 [Lactiplantibacillus plantarum]|nr:hypothetical protein NAB1_2567 [Lactiplantibacillus plantarum]